MPAPESYAFATVPPGPVTGAHVFRTAAGFAAVLVRDATLCRVFLPVPERGRLAEAFARSGVAPAPSDPPAAAKPPIEAMVRYFAGEPIDPAALPLTFDPGPITEFSSHVYAALRRIRRGSVTTYGDLARLSGTPGAARAVGAAMSRNRFPLFVPCHRVLARGGGLGGFSSSGGLDDKRALLRIEGRWNDGPGAGERASSE